MRAAAQNTVYRCGDSYSQQSCPGGRALAPMEAPTPAQRAEAELAAKRNAQAADAMEKARLKQEANAPKAVIIREPEKPKEPLPRPMAMRKAGAPDSVLQPTGPHKKTARSKKHKEAADDADAPASKRKSKSGRRQEG